MKFEFFRQILEKTRLSSFIKIRLAGAEFFLADGQTDMKLIIAFRNFANAPKNQWVFLERTEMRILQVGNGDVKYIMKYLFLLNVGYIST